MPLGPIVRRSPPTIWKVVDEGIPRIVGAVTRDPCNGMRRVIVPLNTLRNLESDRVSSSMFSRCVQAHLGHTHPTYSAIQMIIVRKDGYVQHRFRCQAVQSREYWDADGSEQTVSVNTKIGHQLSRPTVSWAKTRHDRCRCVARPISAVRNAMLR